MPYVIKPGDTLSKVAKSVGITLAELLNLNPKYKADPDNINVGDVLNTPGSSSNEKAKKALGALSAKYETGGRGPGTVSSGAGDAGGVSYGSYQMSSKRGVADKFVTQPDFPFRNDFKNLNAGSSQFSAKWKEIAASHADEFQECQHEYIKRTHYDPLITKINNDDGLDVNTRSFALQNVIWSTAVQHGPGNSVVHKAFIALNMKPSDPDFDKKFISAIYAERGRKNSQGILVHFSGNSISVQKGVANRFKSEETDALNMLNNEV